jgi:sulfate adenylyltransferase
MNTSNNEEFPIGGIKPHGGELINRVLSGEEREEATARAQTLTGLQLESLVNLSDLELLATGAFSPLTGFMVKQDYDRVVEEMHLYSGLIWSIPVTLAVTEDEAASISEEQEITLWQDDTPLAIMTVAEKFQRNIAREAKGVYHTEEEAHPGVARLYRHGNTLLGGDIWLLNWPQPREFPEFRHTPVQTRRMFARRGWRRIVGFQTRNPIHRAHEYIQKTALEITDGLFLHPLVGETKADDIPADVRMRSYEAILRDYYPADRVLLGVFPAAMRYAGPREAVFHALARKNYGCTHFIVGRDHAGVGDYYGTYDAQHIFDEFDPEEIGITPLFFDYTFYCRRCGAVVSAKTCPHDKEDWIYLSGTQVRQMLERGEMLPEEFTRPEVSKILMEGIRAKRTQQEAE